MRPSRPSHVAALDARAIDGLGAPVEVRRHPAARRLTLRVSRTRRAVIVTLPAQCPLDEAGSFLNRNIDWVRQRLDSLPQPVPLRHGMYMPLRGVAHLIVAGETGCRSRLVRRIEKDPHPLLVVPGAGETVTRRLKTWLDAEVRRDLSDRVAIHAKAIGRHPKRIAVRDQTSRWGSCSTTGVLSFSWRLILAPPHVLDYVAAHEVAHLAEMNHGPRFWKTVRQLCPLLEDSKRWLQIYGMDLHRYGAAVST
ncbi:MAG: SprT family zinc-dependent metalloprotease [Hyphomicrobium sp.]|nr:SprT family zinc-dependent metalloprotease [Hyphomicrobium sp.]